MFEVDVGRLWIGNAIDARQPKPLFDAGIEAIVDLAFEEAPAQLPRQFVYCRFPLNDGAGNDARVVVQSLRTTIQLINDGVKTLVACSAGMSRSPTLASFALAHVLNGEPKELLVQVSTQRTLDVKPGLWKELESAYRLLSR